MFKHFYRLMVVALGFFVASSCGEATPKYGNIYTDYDDGTVDEDVAESEAITPDEDVDNTLYGCIGCEFDVQGTVLNEQGVPIPNIEAIMYAGTSIAASTRTDQNGAFSLVLKSNYGCDIGDPETVPLTFNDTDGSANGGNFESKKVDVVLPWDYNNGYGWDPCAYKKSDIEVKLDKVGNDDDTLLKD
ncbi:MAG TPA: radical SAM-associated putative lipoprotein [bacterium]|nr:radical SAM-associated putative lipoprotein [bacterium]